MTSLQDFDGLLEVLNNTPAWLSTIIALSGGLFGLIGTTLGIANFYMSISERKVYIRISPSISFKVNHDGFLNVSSHTPERLHPILEQGMKPIAAIQVTNMSRFPIVIDEVGFCYSSPENGERCAFIRPEVIPNSTLPLRLEPRESLTAYGDLTHINYVTKGMDTAYAVTSCDVVKTIRSKNFIKNVKYVVEYFAKK